MPCVLYGYKNFNLKPYEHKISYMINTFLYLWHFSHAVFLAHQVQRANIWKERNSILPDQYLFAVIRGNNEWLLQWHFMASFQSIRQLFWKSHVSLESITNGKENSRILLAWDLFIWELYFFHLAKHCCKWCSMVELCNKCFIIHHHPHDSGWWQSWAYLLLKAICCICCEY